MVKNTKKRAIIYSNVKENKKKAEEVAKIKENQINLNDEVIIGISKKTNNKSVKNKNNKPIKSKNNKPIRSNKKSKSKTIQKKKSGQVKKPIDPKKKRRIIAITRSSILGIILVIGLAILLKSSLFNIKKIDIRITNNKILTESQIKELSTVNIGQNIYSINKKKIAENIKSEPYVESVKVKRSLPNILKIEIEERSVKFQLDNGGQYIYIDNHGYILEENSEQNDKILVAGYSTTDLSNGNRLNEEDLKRLSIVMQIMQEADNNGIKENITKIDIGDKDDYKIYFDGLGKMAHLGDSTSINDKMTYIKKILEVESNYEGEIFVNVNLNNGEYPHFRERV